MTLGRRAGVVQFVAFVVVLGIPDGALGVLWPSMRHSFGRPLGDLGVLSLAGTALYFLGGLVFAALAHRLRVGQLLLWACVVSAGTAGLWAAAPSWGVLLGAVALFGLGRGVLDAAVNASAATGIRRLGWIHAGWAVGGSVGPLLVTALAGAGSWRLPVTVIAVASAAVSLAAVPVRNALGGTTAPGGAEEPRAQPPAARGRRRAQLAIVATFAAYTAAETGPIAWGYVYLTEHDHLGARAAAIAVALFWLALTAGRLALALHGHRVGAAWLVDRSCVVAALALAVFWLAPTAVAVGALAVAGFAFAAMFPLLVNLTPQMVGQAAGDRTVGFAIAGAALGGPAAVLVEGRLADHLGVGSIGVGLFVAAVVLVAVNAWGARLRRRP